MKVTSIIFKTIIPVVVLLIIACSILSFCGLLSSEWCSVIVTNSIVVLLFAITFVIFDLKNLKDRTNKFQIAITLIKNDYNQCLNFLRVFESKDLRKNVLSKLESDAFSYNNDYYNNLISVSFKNYEIIMQYANQGILTTDTIKEYLYIKDNYSSVITGYVLSQGMIDVENAIDLGRENLQSKISEALGHLPF